MTARRANATSSSRRQQLDPLVHSPTAQAKRREPWLRFVAAVARDFTEGDLGLMAWSTVKGLVAHVGIVDPMDVALVQVHWQEHASRVEAKRKLIAQQARDAAEERQREEDARIAAEEKTKREAEEAARAAAEAEIEAAQRKKLGLGAASSRFSPRVSITARPSSVGVTRRSASPNAVSPSPAAKPTTTTATMRKPSASPDARSKAVVTPPPASSTNTGAVKAAVSPRPGSAGASKVAVKPSASSTAAASPAPVAVKKTVVVTEPAKQPTPRGASATAAAAPSSSAAATKKPTTTTAAAAAPSGTLSSSSASGALSPPSPATRTRNAEAKAAAIFSVNAAASRGVGAAPSTAAAAPTTPVVSSPTAAEPVTARTSVELDLFMATPDRREPTRSASPFSAPPQLGADGEPLSVDDVKGVFKEWCLYAHGTTDKAINFGRFMRWMKAIGVVDRHFLPRDAEQVFRSAMQQYHSIEAKRTNGGSPAESPHRAPSVASVQSIATAAGEAAAERMPYHVFRMRLMPELASKLRCTVHDLVKRFHYCGGPKEPSPKKRVDVYYTSPSTAAA